MLKKRLIPVLILRDGNVVQSLRFQHTNIIHSKVSIVVDHFNRWEVDEIIVIDVSPDQSKRDRFYTAVSELARRCFVPLCVGGWITTTDEILTFLKCGADKVTINTQAVKYPDFIRECAAIYGSQCIVLAIDVRINNAGRYEVFIDRGKVSTGLSPFDWAKEAQHLGAGEIFVTSIDKDGTRTGYDLDLMKKMVDSVDIPVIAYGGVSTCQHFVDGIVIGKVDAVSAANYFHYTDYSAKKAKNYMKKAGIYVR